MTASLARSALLVDLHRQERKNESMQAHGTQRGTSRSGQAVILAGVATFLIGSFLPFYSLEPRNETLSFASQMLSGLSNDPQWVLGGILMLFAATAVVVVTAGIGLGELARATAAPTLVGAATTWVLTWVGALLRSTGFPVAVGYFVMWVGIAVVIVGTVIVFRSMRSAPAAPMSDEGPFPEVRQSS